MNDVPVMPGKTQRHVTRVHFQWRRNCPASHWSFGFRVVPSHRLTPEEDVIGDLGESDDNTDETLPGDLWF
ncbi:MAG: hypothetical protein C4346_08350 [Chloroflexota bacterium]